MQKLDSWHNIRYYDTRAATQYRIVSSKTRLLRQAPRTPEELLNKIAVYIARQPDPKPTIEEALPMFSRDLLSAAQRGMTLISREMVKTALEILDERRGGEKRDGDRHPSRTFRTRDQVDPS